MLRNGHALNRIAISPPRGARWLALQG